MKVYVTTSLFSLETFIVIVLFVKYNFGEEAEIVLMRILRNKI